MMKTQGGCTNGLCHFVDDTMILSFNGCWKRRICQGSRCNILSTSLDFTLGHQRPTATSAFSWASVCLANISSERSRCALAEPDCRSDHSGFGKPCHVERSSNFQARFELKKHHRDYCNIIHSLSNPTSVVPFPAWVCGMMANGGNCCVLLASHLNLCRREKLWSWDVLGDLRTRYHALYDKC